MKIIEVECPGLSRDGVRPSEAGLPSEGDRRSWGVQDDWPTACCVAPANWRTMYSVLHGTCQTYESKDS